MTITQEQLDELEKNIHNIDFKAAEKEERATRHDVMAHVHVLATLCPLAAPIIHLGATSCYVTDNTDLITMRDGFDMILSRLSSVIHQLALFANKYK